MILIYECKDLFLYEILEDYRETTAEEKDEIFRSFCSCVWSSDNKRRLYKKAVRFNVKKELLDTELGQVFDRWSSIEYTYYKSVTKDENWRAIIRQKINNIYTRYFDEEVILEKEYMDLLKTPEKLYYQWISGIHMDAETVADSINDCMKKALQVKARLQMEKMTLSWNEYKKVMEEFLKRCFDHCRLIEEYEDNTRISAMVNFLTEDHFYVGYICKSLEGEILKWQKRYYHVRDHKKYSRCRQCGSIIEKTNNRVLYCKKCYKEINQKDARNRMKKYREAMNKSALP